MPTPALLRRLRRHLFPILFIGAVVVFLFRLPLFESYRFIGNSDRWNHHLSFVSFHVHNLAIGTLSAWSEYLLGGFDTLATPGNFFSPLFALPVLLGTRDIVVVFGYVAMAHFTAALLSAYVVLHRLSGDRLAACAGALVFGLSVFSLLKLSQNDNEYLPLLLVPMLFYLVDTTRPTNLFRRTAVLSIIFWFCIYVSFLQPFAYTVIFLLAYGGYLWVQGQRGPLVALAAALAAGGVLAAPRVLVQLQEISESVRTSEGVIEYVGPLLFLRYLNGNIFGRSWREAFDAHVINLSEGNLMFASMFASLLLLLIIFRGRYTAAPRTHPDRAVRYGFFISFVICVLLVIHNLSAYHLFALLFLKVSFLHTRFTLAALFPIAIVTSLYLTRDIGWRWTPRRILLVTAVASAVSAFALIDFDRLLGAVTSADWSAPTFVHVPGSRSVSVLVAELLHWVVMVIAFVSLLIARRAGWLEAGTFRMIVAVVIIGQSVLSADHFLNGRQTREYSMPFERYDSVQGRPDDFLSPTEAQVARLHERLDNDRYRSVVVCPREVIAVDCSTSIGMKWRIRLADGYLNSVSRRYLALPWPAESRGGRAIRVLRLPGSRSNNETSTSDRPWRLLGLLNVRTALVVSPALYSNRSGRAPEGVETVTNPSPYIYPRVFFASRVVSSTAAEAREAIQIHFGPCRTPRSPCPPLLTAKHPVDYVEGPVAGEFDAAGEITWHFAGDEVTIQVTPSRQRRFLVINEAYHRRWAAQAHGVQLPIYPTNAVMRGLLVPEGVTTIHLRYHTVLADTGKYLLAALPMVGLLGVVLRRLIYRLASPGARRS